MIHDSETKTVIFEQPSLEVLGIPVAWLPWLSVPDPTSGRTAGFRLPSANYDENIRRAGHGALFHPGRP